ncbi:hypothetical protein K469DRAFT_708332 [Zopfia rhizophila CBS 207.26]|uniref:Uncharacterized protein n=1 Tax=Zopfia rhizophila CBS 207.26 TaxID=1314779 RepID=A0A6A6E233_9PEZI|nr:hypothetical protein K469DRAFT_708332 [Zopfia rhizophila CBS 207.26]
MTKGYGSRLSLFTILITAAILVAKACYRVVKAPHDGLPQWSAVASTLWLCGCCSTATLCTVRNRTGIGQQISRSMIFYAGSDPKLSL